jgi:hypothetical protein
MLFVSNARIPLPPLYLNLTRKIKWTNGVVITADLNAHKLSLGRNALIDVWCPYVPTCVPLKANGVQVCEAAAASQPVNVVAEASGSRSVTHVSVKMRDKSKREMSINNKQKKLSSQAQA